MPDFLKEHALKHLALASGAGVGGVVAIMLVRALVAEPEAFLKTVAGFGPWFIGAVLAMAFLDRRVSEGVQVMRENATAQEKLAAAVQSIASKDDRQAELMQREIRYVGTQVDKLMERFDEIQKANERARGMHG